MESMKTRATLAARWLSPMRTVYGFMLRHSLCPLALSSLLACGIWVGRVVRSHSLTGGGLIWNLFLAWAPYLCSLWVAYLHRRHQGQWWRLLIPSALWLIFFPNAPYIITDLWHLRERPPIPMWYDIGFFVSFAWTGCLLGIASLRAMQCVVQSFLGRVMSWLFAIGVLGLSGFGIYLGRFLGWNSWDLIVNPGAVLSDMAAWLLHPRTHLQAYVFALLFAAILFVFYLTFTSVQQQETP
jgi:uncharacterized membrane protein